MSLAEIPLGVLGVVFLSRLSSPDNFGRKIWAFVVPSTVLPTDSFLFSASSLSSAPLPLAARVDVSMTSPKVICSGTTLEPSRRQIVALKVFGEVGD